VVRSILMTGHIDMTDQVKHEIEKRHLPILFKPVDFKVLMPLLSLDAVTR